jgi:protein-tyrosine phosphatase
MFSIFKKKNYLVDLLADFHDVHSHLLWGVDDGCADQKATDHLANQLAELGFSHIYLTPHVIYGLYDNQDEKSLRERYAQMAPHPKVEYRLGAEYFLDENFMNHLNSDTPLLTLGDRWLLTEYGMGASRAGNLDALFEAQMGGYNIIIAHPERYAAIQRDPGLADELVRMGCKLQLSTDFISGGRFGSERRPALQMLKSGLVSYLASDAHRKGAYADFARAVNRYGDLLV